MSKLDYPAGFYGKLPSHGDFVSRRLPRYFIEPWDKWLQGGLAASQEQLGQAWLNTYLVSPIWQFALAPGICGADAWAGVMMPSVDRVGRYFPLTVAARINESQIPGLFEADCGWFAALSQLALSSLDYQFDLQAFDNSLERICLSDFLSGWQSRIYQEIGDGNSRRLAFQFQLDSVNDTPKALELLSREFGTRFLQSCSIWLSMETDVAKSLLLVCEGLPPLDAYVGFLKGTWPDRGWQLSTRSLRKSAQPDTISSAEPPAIADNHDDPLQSASEDTLPPLNSGRADSKPWQSYGMSVVGLRRKLNEDAILDRPEAGMWVVADGMGGHSAGDVASQALVNSLATIVPVDDIEFYSERVASCLHSVNRDLVQLAQLRGAGHIIGSTVVVLLIAGKRFHYLWAGDSRLYRYRQGVLQQLTSDQSLYNESINQGLDPLDGSLEQGRGNVITRAVGADLQLQLECGRGDIEPGDLFLLTSDGIDKELSHNDICALCANDSVSDIVNGLIREAEVRGGRDNISVVVVKI